MDISSILPYMISAYQSSQKSDSTMTTAQKQALMKDFSTLLRASMMESTTSALSSFGSDDKDDSGDFSSGLSSLLSGLNGNSSNQSASLLNSLLGESGDSASLLSGLLDNSSESSSLLSGLLGNSGLSSSLLSGLLGSTANSGTSSALLSALTGSSANSSLAGLLGANKTGSNSNSMLSSSLYEQMLSQQIQQAYQSQSQHVNQFQAEMLNGYDGANADCGPAALVMALHELGLNVPGETNATNNGQAIDLARKAMTLDPAKDGVDENGKRVDAEHNTFTDFSELARGAAAAGAKTQSITANASQVIHALQEGSKVIVSGTFEDKKPLPWTGDSGVDNLSAPGFATEHYVEVSSYDSFSKLFTINDPARNTTQQVSAATLEYFMTGNAGALAIRK